MRHAVITAGGRIDGAYASEAGTTVKALVDVRAATMLDRIVTALREAGIERIAVVGGAQVAAACADRVERVIPEADSGAANVLLALRAWPPGEPVLYATSDMPYVDAAAVRDFVARTPAGALAMPLTAAAEFEARFPGAPPFGVRLGRERVVNGGVFAIPAGSALRLADVAAAFFDARKSPWKMASLVGPAAVLRFAFGQLTVGAVEARASAVLGVPACAVRDAAPELAFDADTLDEYRYAATHE